MSNLTRAHIALALVAVLYGANYIIAKITLGSGLITPQGFIMLRALAACFFLWVAHALFVKEKLARTDMGYVAMCSIFGIAINQLCFFYGLKHTSAMHASLIMITTPVLVLAGSALLLRNKILKGQILGIVLGLAGAALLVWSAGTDGGASSAVGDIYVLINAISYALYLLLAKKILMKYHPITVLKWIFTFGTLFIMPFGFTDMLSADYASFQSEHWWSVVFVLVGATFMTYTLNAYALSKVKASVVGFYLYFQPLIASLIAIGLGTDSLNMTKVQAALLLFVGVYLVTMPPPKGRKSTE